MTYDGAAHFSGERDERSSDVKEGVGPPPGDRLAGCPRSASTSAASSASASAAAASLPPIKHVFIIVAGERVGVDDVRPRLAGAVPLADAGLPGRIRPQLLRDRPRSLDNYIAMIGGQAPNPTHLRPTAARSQTSPPGHDWTPTAQSTGSGCLYPANVPTIDRPAHGRQPELARLHGRHGRRPGARVGDLRSPGGRRRGQHRRQPRPPPHRRVRDRHDPFVYFHSVIDNPADCATPRRQPQPAPGSDSASVATTPNYVFITPDLCNDGHDTAAELRRRPVGWPKSTPSCRPGCRRSPPRLRTSRMACC